MGKRTAGDDFVKGSYKLYVCIAPVQSPARLVSL